jgi:hypothetical protein
MTYACAPRVVAPERVATVTVEPVATEDPLTVAVAAPDIVTWRPLENREAASVAVYAETMDAPERVTVGVTMAVEAVVLTAYTFVLSFQVESFTLTCT